MSDFTEQVYYCNFQASDGSNQLTYHPVKFAGKPSCFVNVSGHVYKKIWELGNRVVYTHISITDISSQVPIYG